MNGGEGAGGAPPPTRPARKYLLIGASVVLAFAVGFGWQYLEASSAREARDTAELELAYHRLGNVLGVAVVQSGYGNYEPARQLASRFYSGLDEQLRQELPAGGGEQALRQILSGRDDMITALSRGNPDAEDLLASAFLRFHRAVGIGDPGPELPATAGSGGLPAGGGAEPATDTSPGGGPGGGGPQDR